MFALLQSMREYKQLEVQLAALESTDAAAYRASGAVEAIMRGVDASLSAAEGVIQKAQARVNEDEELSGVFHGVCVCSSVFRGRLSAFAVW